MAGGYTVQILVSQHAGFDPEALYERLCDWRADIELLHGSPAHLALAVPTEDLPVLVDIGPAEPEVYAQALCDALTWTPRWDEGWSTMAERYHASIVVALRPQHPL